MYACMQFREIGECKIQNRRFPNLTLGELERNSGSRANVENSQRVFKSEEIRSIA